MQKQMYHLKEDLRQFGLNPADWTLNIKWSKGRRQKITVQSKLDQQIWFEGWVARSGSWLGLSLQG